MNSQALTLNGKASTKSKTKSTKNAFTIPKQTIIKMVIFLLVVTILVGSGFTYVYAYSDKVLPKASIAGVNIGGKTLAEAKADLGAKFNEINANGPEITFNNQTLKPTLDEMGITFNLDEAINSAYSYGRGGNLKQRLVENYNILTHHHQIPVVPQISDVQFNQYLNQLQKAVEIEPQNASLKIKNNEIDLVPAITGRGIDKAKVKSDIVSMINNGVTNGQIVMETSNLEPEVLDNETEVARTLAVKYMSAAPMTVTFEGKSWTADRNEIGTWIKFKPENGQLGTYIDADSFINGLAKEIDIPTVDREIQDGTTNVLNEGQDGRGTNTEALKAQIAQALTLGTAGATLVATTYSIPHGEKIIYPHAQPGRYPGRYVDINLSEQTLYAFEGQNLVNQFLISSGKRGYATPTGEYSVWGKTRSQTMDGPGYYLPGVQWISWFNGEISIHGTYWHNNFGTPMSHGCINASNDNAQWIYNWDEIGTPVYVHY